MGASCSCSTGDEKVHRSKPIQNTRRRGYVSIPAELDDDISNCSGSETEGPSPTSNEYTVPLRPDSSIVGMYRPETTTPWDDAQMDRHQTEMERELTALQLQHSGGQAFVQAVQQFQFQSVRASDLDAD